MTKKELKAQYKQEKQSMGVFQVKSKSNGKLLIEGSINIPGKWNRHQTELKFGTHRNKNLQSDWNEFGVENFELSVLSELEIKDGENLNARQEVKQLEEIVLEEMDLEKELRY